MLLKARRYILRFILTVLASAGGLWGAVEAVTYFTDDKLKNSLGPYWVLVFVALPILVGFVVFRFSAEVLTLSKYPLSSRKQNLEIPLVGREDELLWLGEGKSTDRLIHGQPGSGKTFLLSKLVERESNWLGSKYLFAVENDRAKLASEIKALRPKGVIVDDAQSNQEMLLNLKQLRQELKLSFVILAACWPSHKEDIAALLNIPHTPDYLREIPLMDRPKILAVIRSAGLDKNQTLRGTVGRAGINELEREIIDQSVGRPGLAITLVSLCLAATSGPEALQSLRAEILSGQALSREVRKSLRNETEKQCLACFSLGGDSGMPVEAVSRTLELQPHEVQEIINNLTNGGVVWEVSESVLAVHPDTLRYALIGEVFFDSPQALSGWDQLIIVAPSRANALNSIIGTAANGSRVNDKHLRTLIEETVQQSPYDSQLWESYAWIGREQTQWVLENHPETLVWVSKPGLRYVPELVIPLLLEKAQGDRRELHSTVDHPLRIIETWVNQEYWNFSSAKQKRSLLLAAVTDWLPKQTDLFSTFRAIRVALSPTVDFSTVDPTGNSMTVHSGCISSTEMQFLSEKWKEIFEIIKELPITSEWKPIYELIEDWVYDRLFNGKMTEQQIDTKRSIAEMMLRDVTSIAKDHPAILQWIDQLGTQIGFAIDYEVDNFFDVINWPHRYTHGENWQETRTEIDTALNELAEKLVLLGPSTVGEKLKWAISETWLMNSFPAQGYHLCTKLAARTDSPIDWAKSFQIAELPGNLIIPFLEQAARLSQEGWVELALACLGHPLQKNAAISAALQINDAPDRLVDAVLAEEGYEGFLEISYFRSEISENLSKRLLAHPNAAIASAAAWGEWKSYPEHTVRQSVRDQWENIVVNVLSDDFKLSEILRFDKALAERWLRTYLHTDLSRNSELRRTLGTIVLLLNTEILKELVQIVPDTIGAYRVLAYIVGTNTEVFANLLENSRLKEFHLAPLFGHPDERWIPLARVALEHGYSPNDVAIAAMSSPFTGIGWSGSESALWQGRIDSFSRLLTHKDNQIREIGIAGKAYAEFKQRRAMERERRDSILGY